MWTVTAADWTWKKLELGLPLGGRGGGCSNSKGIKRTENGRRAEKEVGELSSTIQFSFGGILYFLTSKFPTYFSSFYCLFLFSRTLSLITKWWILK